MDGGALITTLLISVMGLGIAYMVLDKETKSTIFKKKARTSDNRGNANLTKTIKRFAALKSFEVLPKTTIEYAGTQYTFDAILLGYFGTIAINALNLSGEIYGQTNDEKWVQVVDGKRAEFANPVKELNGCIRFFKDMYRAEKIKYGNADSEAVFTSKKVQLYSGKSSAAITIDKLYAKLNATKYLQDNGADIPAMKAVIEKYTVK